MKIDIGSCEFNISYETGGSTPVFETSIGRQDESKLIYPGCRDLIVAMLHKAVDVNKVRYAFGKDGNNGDGNRINIASVFENVFVNESKVKDGKFLVFIAEQLSGDTLKHIGRKTLKYPKNCEYDSKNINADCFNKMTKTLGINGDAAWFITEINVKNQDELHFTALIIDKDKPFTITEKKSLYSFANYKNHEEEFRTWLDNKSYSEGTKDNCISVIKSLSKEMCIDLFYLNSLEKINDIYNEYTTDETYIEDNKKSNYTRSQGLKNYRDFLQDLLMKKEVGGYNKYFYGAPGCGKSFHIKKLLDEAGVNELNRFRVTFHPEYTNSDFVGQILPTIEKDLNDPSKDKVKYIFNPGPFTKALLRSYQTNDMVYLVVEELNRGNASAIFGDLFQLLDRVDDTSKPNYSESQYPVTNVNVHRYIKEQLEKDGISYRENDIIIPSNLTILATMNTSDQNVFTLDTAFKRRWQSEGISNDIVKDNEHEYKNWYVPGTNITWEKFLDKLNDKILDYKIENSTSEDKRLGKYFVGKNCLTENAKIINDCEDEANNFAYKVLEYVWNDVCKYGQSDWFNTSEYRTLEELLEGYKEKQLAIFENINFNE